MENRLIEILNYLPEHIGEMLNHTFEIVGKDVQEIRIRNKLPLIIGTRNGRFAVLPNGEISASADGAYIVEPQDIQRIFSAVCENSIYAFSEEISQGFITIRGGHRIGLSGRAVMNGQKIQTFRDISSMNIRVAREIIGAADTIVDYVITPGEIKNTLIVAPPMGGKTTVLRDLARQISDKGIKTAIADERGELASLYKGVPQNDVGIESDIIENAPKAEAALMMLRTMSPQVIITDEVSTRTDSEALIECFGMGVSVIASTHGENADEVQNREFLKPLFAKGGFSQIIVLKKEDKAENQVLLGDVRLIKQ